MFHKIIFCLFLFSFTQASFGQQAANDSTPSLTKMDYLKKSRHQKTAAWILTGVGTAGLLITFGSDLSQVVVSVPIIVGTAGEVEPQYKSFTVPYLISAACIGAGIGYFIAASKNKRRAASLNTSAYFKIEKARMLHYASFNTRYYPAVAFSIRLP